MPHNVPDANRAIMTFPLLSVAPGEHASHVVAYRRGAAIRAEAFLRDVYTVAQSLPPAQHVLNLCGDRYHIAVLLAAVMLRGAINLLPPNTAPVTLQALMHDWPDTVMVTDDVDVAHFPGAIQLSSLLANRFSGETPMPAIPADQLVGILFTSGSTGVPSANPRTWGGLCTGVRAEAEALGLPQLGGGQSVAILGTVPAQHSYGLESTLALPMQNGHALSADASFYPADILAALDALPRPRALVTTPFHLRMLLESADTLPAIDLIVSATAPLAQQLALRAEARFGAPLREIYGCTEAGQVAWRRTTAGEAWTLFPGVTLSERDGITWVGGGHVGSPRPLGDIIEIIGGQQFLLHGRAGDMVNVAGKRTSLAHLNFQLNAIDGVADGIFVVPVDNAHHDADARASRLSALVVSKSLSAEQILIALRERIDPIFLPRPLRLVSEIPRNATGKVTQQDLRAALAAS
jgi:acyl-coenzyme A synthetase/AMP-(fatty) acid ligase